MSSIIIYDRKFIFQDFIIVFSTNPFKPLSRPLPKDEDVYTMCISTSDYEFIFLWFSAWCRCLLPKKLPVTNMTITNNFSSNCFMWSNSVLGVPYFSGHMFVSNLQLLPLFYSLLLIYFTKSCWPICVSLNSLTLYIPFFQILIPSPPELPWIVPPVNSTSEHYCPFYINDVVNAFVEVWGNYCMDSEEGVSDFTSKERVPKRFPRNTLGTK